MRIVRGLPLRSSRLGLSGIADVVEFHPADAGGVPLPGAPGRWRPFPIEYKRGRAKEALPYHVQLCAQAICLEEMLKVAVPAGAMFYGRTRRRFDVEFDETLRETTEDTARRLHELLASSTTPPAVYEKKCRSCSLVEICMPKAGAKRSAVRYLEESLEAQ